MITIGGKNIADISISNKNVIKVQDAITLEIMWEKTSQVVDYFYIENIYSDSNTLYLTTQSNSPTGNHATSLQYSKDKTNWTTITLSGTNTIPMSQGEKVYFRNDNGYFNWFSNVSNRFVTSFACSENFNVGGNINSLLNYTNNNVSLSPYCFYKLFVDSNTFKLINASNLTLPSTTLVSHCYDRMFYNCSNLTSAPSLPATTLADYCYYQMFYGCTSLTTAPSLPATTLAQYCYGNMFYGCTSLTTAPSLPATTLVSHCYDSMFYNCSNLTSAPSLPATTLTISCYISMFRGCTSLITTPELPATTLANYCYRNMFRGCTSLNKVTTYANDISATNCLADWLDNVAPTGTFNNYGTATYTIDSPSGIPVGWTEVKHSPYENEYFFIENVYNGNNVLHFKEPSNVDTVSPSSDYATTIQYSKDKTNWTTVDLDYLWNNYIYEFTVNLSQGEKVYFRNNNGYFTYFAPTTTDPTRRVYTIECENSFAAGGNINSLLDYQNMSTVTLKNNCFRNLFSSLSSNLVDVGNLVLPSTTLAERCYQQLFAGANISVAPTLPATTLAKGCYNSMFSSCRSLITPPKLPATTLAESCYSGMFSGCTSLTTTPVLPATTLNNSCYAYMFEDCTSLTTAPVLPATTLAEYCYYNMFQGCTSLTSAPALPATTLAKNCYSNMFYMCSALTTAPALPATTLVERCYERMFERCTSLNDVTSYANTPHSTSALLYWLESVAATGTFHKLGTYDYSTGSSGIPSGWTVVNN